MNTVSLLQAVAEFCYTDAVLKAEDGGEFKSVMRALVLLTQDEIHPLARLDKDTQEKVLLRVRKIAKDLLT